jgi:hypothetical protein
MSFSSGYRGVAGGSVQAAYTDQPGVGVPGMLAFASDINLVDSVYVGETNGLAAGRGCKFTAVSDTYSLQRPNVEAVAVATGDDVNDFEGIVVFDEAMQSDENGVPGWAHGRMARVLRKGRVGGRIYVKAPVAFATTDTLYLVTVADAGGVYEVGGFAVSSLGGGAAGTSTSLATVAKIVVGAAAGGLALIELIA